MSLILLVLPLVYWAIAVRWSPDFNRIGGDEHFTHRASIAIGGIELTWILEQRRLIIAAVTGAQPPQMPRVRPLHSPGDGECAFTAVNADRTQNDGKDRRHKMTKGQP
jgi:hypothetical protein